MGGTNVVELIDRSINSVELVGRPFPSGEGWNCSHAFGLTLAYSQNDIKSFKWDFNWPRDTKSELTRETQQVIS